MKLAATRAILYFLPQGVYVSDLLHMETDQLYACASRIYAHADEIQQQVRNLLIVGRSVEWYGPDRDYFQSELEHLLQRFLIYTEIAQNFAVRVEQGANQWQAIDGMYAQKYVSIIVPEVGEIKSS